MKLNAKTQKVLKSYEKWNNTLWALARYMAASSFDAVFFACPFRRMETGGAQFLDLTHGHMRWHVVIECEVVRRLWRKLEPTLVRIVDGQVVDGEMAFGPLGERAADRLRRRLGFGLRSAVHTMRGVELGGVERAVERVWGLFVGRLRKQLEEEWVLAMWQGKVGSFAASVLVGGVLGKMVEGRMVEWCGILDGVGYRGWDLFG